jgi:hypothetical protein
MTRIDIGDLRRMLIDRFLSDSEFYDVVANVKQDDLLLVVGKPHLSAVARGRLERIWNINPKSEPRSCTVEEAVALEVIVSTGKSVGMHGLIPCWQTAPFIRLRDSR